MSKHRTVSESEAQALRATRRDLDDHLDDHLPDGAWDGKLVPFLDLFDVLGRRWSLRVIWELRPGPATFRDLRARTGGVSSSVLNDRLRDLRSTGVVEHRPGAGYALTPMGAGLAERIVDIYRWLHDEHGIGEPREPAR